MNIQELNYVLCIARHQNLTEAAQELYLSKPTLSKYLQKLEREMDGKLFSRVGNRYLPTYLGRRYLEYARRMLVLPREHPLAQCGVSRPGCSYPWMDLRLLAGEPFVLHYPEQTTGRIAQDLFDFYGIHPPVPFRTRNTQVCAALCQQGLGACFLPQRYLQTLYPQDPPLCFSVGEQGTFSRLTIAYRKGAYLPTYARAFIRICKDYA